MLFNAPTPEEVEVITKAMGPAKVIRELLTEYATEKPRLNEPSPRLEHLPGLMQALDPGTRVNRVITLSVGAYEAPATEFFRALPEIWRDEFQKEHSATIDRLIRHDLWFYLHYNQAILHLWVDQGETRRIRLEQGYDDLLRKGPWDFVRNVFAPSPPDLETISYREVSISVELKSRLRETFKQLLIHMTLARASKDEERKEAIRIIRPLLDLYREGNFPVGTTGGDEGPLALLVLTA